MNERMPSIPFLKRILLLILLCGQLMTGSFAVQAAEEDLNNLEPSGQPDPAEFTAPADLPDTLTVKTGFANAGPNEYQEARSFGLSELEALDLYLTDYTFLDAEGRLYIVRAQGFLLRDLLREAGMELEDVSTLHFLSSTPEGDRTVSFSKEELLDTGRFCNYSLVNYYEEETGTLAVHKRWMAAETDVMIALQDSWIPAAEGGSFEEDGEDLLDPGNRFRLIFGQADCLERDAEQALGGIHTILVQFSGEISEEADITGLSGEDPDSGLSEEGPIREEAGDGNDLGDKEELDGTEESGPDRPEAESPVSAQYPSGNPAADSSSVEVSAGKTAGKAMESSGNLLEYAAEAAADHPVERKLSEPLTEPSLPEADGENGGNLEIVPISLTSGRFGQAAAEKLPTGGLKKEVAEENPEGGRPSGTAGHRDTMETAPETEMQRLLPVTIRNADGNGSFNPLLRPVGWMTFIIFLFGGLTEFIHVHRERGGLCKEGKARFSFRCLRMTAERNHSGSDGRMCGSQNLSGCFDRSRPGMVRKRVCDEQG